MQNLGDTRPFIFVKQGDRLFVTLTSIEANAEILASGVMELENGTLSPFDFNLILSGGATSGTFTQNIGTGKLLAISFRASSWNPLSGDAHINAFISTSGVASKSISYQICNGFIVGSAGIGFPFCPTHEHIGPFNNPVIATGSNPAAGANFFWGVKTNRIILLHMVRFTLTNDANVANRTPAIVFGTSAPTFDFPFYASRNIAASASRGFFFSSGYGDTLNTNLSRDYFPQNLPLIDAFQLIIRVDSIQVGDQISAIQIIYSSFPKYQ